MMPRVKIVRSSARRGWLPAPSNFIEITAAEPVWGRLLISAFTEFDAFKEDVAGYMRRDVALGIEQNRFNEPLDEFVIDAHFAILRAGVIARLEGDGPDVAARAAEYQLRILGMSARKATNPPSERFSSRQAVGSGLMRQPVGDGGVNPRDRLGRDRPLAREDVRHVAIAMPASWTRSWMLGMVPAGGSARGAIYKAVCVEAQSAL